MYYNIRATSSAAGCLAVRKCKFRRSLALIYVAKLLDSMSGVRTRTLAFVHTISVAVHTVSAVSGPGPGGMFSEALFLNVCNSWAQHVLGSGSVVSHRPTAGKP